MNALVRSPRKNLTVLFDFFALGFRQFGELLVQSFEKAIGFTHIGAVFIIDHFCKFVEHSCWSGNNSALIIQEVFGMTSQSIHGLSGWHKLEPIVRLQVTNPKMANTRMKKTHLDTPCLVIDQSKLLHNLKKMQAQVTAKHKALRPHIKTHKCSVLAKQQIAHGAIGVSAAKVSEALVLAEAVVCHTLVTSPIVTDAKCKVLKQCHALDPSLIVVCDSAANAVFLNTAFTDTDRPLHVLVDVDPGVGRTGVPPEDALKLGQFITQHCPALSLKGIQCYAGNLQHITDYADRQNASHTVMERAAALRHDFLHAGLPCDILSGAGTGNYMIDMEVDGVTEVQPGSYTVMDVEYREIGSKEHAEKFEDFQPAMTLLVTVISANHTTHVTVDAGTKSIYVDANTRPKIISNPGLRYDLSVFGDEYGKVTAEPGTPLPQVGEVLELIVPHCEPTINLHTQFHITENDDVVDTWAIDMRGCVQ